jgi:lipoprotein NlpD
VRIFQNIVLILLTLFLSACVDDVNYAPVADASGIESMPKNGIHRVHSGETLYSIAWRYGLDYRALARRNHIAAPYHVHTGEILYLRKAPTTATANTTTTTPTSSNQIQQPTTTTTTMLTTVDTDDYFETGKEPTATVDFWHWPAVGRVSGGFSQFNKGINISGTTGAPIYAAAAGKVVYSGHGLRGYGNLLIIKHNSTYLTAYAHNQKNLVTEGQWVKMGQIIAEMGNTGASKVMLHFEIRRGGDPVNPLIYLEKS